MADIVGAATLVASQAAIDALTVRGAKRERDNEGGERLMDASQVIIRPVVSEKSYVLATADRYTFRVHADAHKTQIKQAVEQLFDVNVVEVRTLSVKSKPKRRGYTAGPHARLEEGHRAGASRPVDPDLPGPGGRSVMPIRKPKPTSPGRRFVSYADYAEITKTKPEKSLTEGLKKSGGRNAHGRKTSRHRGGGAKRLYRKIDFKRTKDGIPARSPRSSTTRTAPPTSRC